jgi:hypothetical protein
MRDQHSATYRLNISGSIFFVSIASMPAGEIIACRGALLQNQTHVAFCNMQNATGGPKKSVPKIFGPPQFLGFRLVSGGRLGGRKKADPLPISKNSEKRLLR